MWVCTFNSRMAQIKELHEEGGEKLAILTMLYFFISIGCGLLFMLL